MDGRPQAPAHEIEVERVRGERPRDDRWRADALGRSRHARLADHIRQPLHDPDPARARLLCAAVCRDLLGDLSPALVLLSRRDRRRVQALAAYLRSLFDFSLEPGLDGERLARINRWQFELESALSGEEPGQPIFVAMRQEHEDRPWPSSALDSIAGSARRIAVSGNMEVILEPLAVALCDSLPGLSGSPEAAGTARRLLPILVARSRDLAAGARGEAPSPASGRERPGLQTAVLSRVPRSWRRFLRFLASAAEDHRLSDRAVPRPLGLAKRIRLLLFAFLPG